MKLPVRLPPSENVPPITAQLTSPARRGVARKAATRSAPQNRVAEVHLPTDCFTIPLQRTAPSLNYLRNFYCLTSVLILTLSPVSCLQKRFQESDHTPLGDGTL